MQHVVSVEVVEPAQQKLRVRIGCQRYRYRQFQGRWLNDVVVNVTQIGEEEWSERFSGEYQGYPHNPCAAEPDLLDRWRTADGATTAEAGMGVVL